MVLSSLLVLTAAGTFGYNKWKENDLTAKAGRGAFVNMTPWHPHREPTGGNYDNAKTYICKVADGNRTIVRIVTSAYRTKRGPNSPSLLRLLTYQSGSKGNPGNEYEVKQSRSWWGLTDPKVTTLQAYVPASGWAKVYFLPAYDDYWASVATAPVQMGFVPYC